ncbi:MAG: MFS transporter [Clostridium beijerinckii]|nr:MFS transporter [Clostridium beijerinckii]
MPNIKRNLKILTNNRILTGMGYYISIPLLAIILTDMKNINIQTASIIIALFNFSTKAGSLLSFLFPKLLRNKKHVLVLGTLFSSIGFLSSGFVDKPLILSLFLILAGFGISINILGIQTYISSNVTGSEKLDRYTIQIWIANLTAIIGPILGAHCKSSIALLISGCFYLLAFLNIAIIFKESNIETNCGNEYKFSYIFKECLSNKSFLLFLGLVFLMWFIYSQLYFIFPIYVTQYLGYRSIIGYLFAMNAIILVLFQKLTTNIISRFIKEQKNIFYSIFVGFMAISVGYFLILMGKQYALLLWGGILIISIGELINMPLFDYFISGLGNKISTGYYFSIYTIICGVGYGLSTYTFGNLIPQNFNMIFTLLIILSLMAGTAALINGKYGIRNNFKTDKNDLDQ